MATQYVIQDFHSDSVRSAEEAMVEYMNNFDGVMYLEATIIKKDSGGNDYICAIFGTEDFPEYDKVN